MNRHDLQGKWGRALLCGAMAVGLTLSSPLAQAQYGEPYGMRHIGPVERTIEDLEAVANQNGIYSHRERERYDNALRHLSQFQNSLSRRNFDKGKLDQAIGDVQNVVDHNPMDGRAKDVLWHDLSALRSLRARYDHGYGPY